MKILFLTPRGSKNNLGGVEKHVRILTEELERRGNEVNELSLDQTDKSYKDYKNYKDQDNTSIASLDSSTRRKLLARNDVFFKFRAWKYLWDRRELLRWADVIHVHDVFWWILPFIILPTAVMRICEFWRKKDKGNQKDKKIDGGFFKGTWRNLEDFRGRQRIKPVFITFHGWEGVCPPTRSAVWQKRLAQKLSQGTIGVGRFFKKWYGVVPDRIVWGVVDPKINKGPAFRLAKGRALRKIIFLGRLERVNGIEILLGALDKYYKSYKDYKNQGIKFIFVGDGSYRKQAEKLGKVTGMVKNPEKYLVSADLVIASSYMSILEAAAIGKPIIAVANSELKEDYLMTHPLRRYIEVVKNADELYKGLTLVNQGETLKDLEVAQEWANKQTPERLADIYEELWG